MKVYTLLFSPTGGTRRVAEQLALAFAPEWTEIDLMKPTGGEEVSPDSLCIIAVPSFGGRVPQAAIDRLTAVRGNGAMAVLVCVYGNRAYEDTLSELQDGAESAGFVPVAGVAAIAEHSVIRSFAAGRPDSEDVAELNTFACRIRGMVEEGVRKPLTLPGNRPYKERGPSSMHPEAGEGCTHCGICAEVCPVDAIASGKMDRCISCMACVAACPLGVRSVDRKILAAVEEKLRPLCEGRKANELFL